MARLGLSEGRNQAAAGPSERGKPPGGGRQQQVRGGMFQ